jgi:hypothetical protein
MSVDMQLAEMLGLRIDPSRHEVQPVGYWLRGVKERFPKADLFVYRHRETGRFILCQWIMRHGDGGVARELIGMSGPPDHHPADLPTPMDLLKQLMPAEAARRLAAQEEREKMDVVKRGQEASEAQRKEAVRWAKKRGLDTAVLGLEAAGAPYVGDMEGGEEGAAMAEEFEEMAAARVYSVPGQKPGRNRGT